MYDYSLRRESAHSEADRTALLRDSLARHGFSPSADSTAIQGALALGAATLGADLVPAATVRACELKTRRCFFVRRSAAEGLGRRPEEDSAQHLPNGPGGCVDGFIALLFLNAAGYEALMYARFSPAAPDLDHLTQDGERASAIYVWCLAGATPQAQRAVARAVTEARRKAFPDIALFARPLTREGRMMTAALDAPGGGAAFLGWVPAQEDG